MLSLSDYDNAVQALHSSQDYSTVETASLALYVALGELGCTDVDRNRLSFRIYENGIRLKPFLLPDGLTAVVPYVRRDICDETYIGVSSNSQIIHHERFDSFETFVKYIADYIVEHCQYEMNKKGR